MRKKLIAAIVLLLLLLAAGVGVIIYMENGASSADSDETVPATSTEEATQGTTEALEETAELSWPTEGIPGMTFGPEDFVPPQTMDSDEDQNQENTCPDEVTTPPMPL